MQSYTWYVPRNELDEFYKMRFRLDGQKVPLYFLPTTELVDSINVSDPFTKNSLIGYTTVNYVDDHINHVFYIDDNTDIGNMAIELTDQIIDNNLTKDQLYIVTTIYATELRALLSLKLGILGPVQEDYFSAYFTGKTIRSYGYRKKDYWKQNYTEEELQMGDTFTYGKFDMKGFIHRKLYGRKNTGNRDNKQKR